MKKHYTEKQLWIFAGPNGAGKSTFADTYIKDRIPIINPDTIALKIDPKNRNERKVVLQAGRKALEERLQSLEKNKSFAIETTFSGRSEIVLMKKAKERGFKVNLIYIGIKDISLSKKRVISRTGQGGHNVPAVDIERRFDRSMESLKIGWKIADRAFILDNSIQGQKPTLLLRKEHSSIKYLKDYPVLPAWFKKVFEGEK